tara:strand:+ start:520 stop:855 length:336 start_codon:yes stop_codon:yes gene_type:complete
MPMNQSIAKKLINKKIINKNSDLFAKTWVPTISTSIFKEKDMFIFDIKKDDEGKVYFVGQDRDILRFKYNVKVEDVITVEGMDPMILADIYGLTGNKKSKKRGRKTKTNTV